MVNIEQARMDIWTTTVKLLLTKTSFHGCSKKDRMESIVKCADIVLAGFDAKFKPSSSTMPIDSPSNDPTDHVVSEREAIAELKGAMAKFGDQSDKTTISASSDSIHD
jgi:hypothetical protein